MNGPPRGTTVGSLKRHKEDILQPRIEYTPERTYVRWRCSCNAVGRWYAVGRPYFRTGVARLWQAHVRARHPEFTP